MKQGGAAPTGKWQGTPTGGVASPDPILLPNPSARFAATAARLEALAPGHPMEEWLKFMAGLVSAQRQATAVLSAVEPMAPSEVELAVETAMPPLAADGHRRDPAWRAALSRILEAVEAGSLPPQAREIVGGLRGETPAAIEALADQFLSDRIPADDAGAALYVAAALQVYFTVQASRLDVERLQLLPQRGLCPCCGSTPSAGMISATGKTPGARYLYCSLCSTAWNHVRAVCVTCGDSRSIMIERIEGDDGLVRAETCGACRTYAKMIYQKLNMRADPYADDLASLGLDILMGEAGWSRNAPNPMLLVG